MAVVTQIDSAAVYSKFVEISEAARAVLAGAIPQVEIDRAVRAAVNPKLVEISKGFRALAGVMPRVEAGQTAMSVLNPKFVEISEAARAVLAGAIPQVEIDRAAQTMPRAATSASHVGSGATNEMEYAPRTLDADLLTWLRQLIKPLILTVGPVAITAILGILWSVAAHKSPEAEQRFFAILAILGILLAINPYIERIADKFSK